MSRLLKWSVRRPSLLGLQAAPADSAHCRSLGAGRFRVQLRRVLALVGCLWAVYVFSILVPVTRDWGLVPRSWWGLVGILSMPLLHGRFWYLMGNTIPLIVLLSLLVSSRRQGWAILGVITVGCGVLLWLFGMKTNHTGASGVIMGLITFLVLIGFLERRPVGLLISLLVGFMYGGTLLWALLSILSDQVPWDAHLSGAVAGILAAWGFGGRAGRGGADVGPP